MHAALAYLFDHIPSIIAAFGALYAGRKAYTIEINTDGRLIELTEANTALRKSNADLLAAIRPLIAKPAKKPKPKPKPKPKTKGE